MDERRDSISNLKFSFSRGGKRRHICIKAIPTAQHAFLREKLEELSREMGCRCLPTETTHWLMRIGTQLHRTLVRAGLAPERDERQASWAANMDADGRLAHQVVVANMDSRVANVVADVPMGLADVGGMLAEFHYQDEEKGPEHIYFLVDQGEVVYVGRTKHLARRTSQHIAKGIGFDRVLYIEFLERDAAWLEEHFIRRFDPQYNRAGRDLVSA